MSEHCLVINIDRCVNCKSCEIACQINHKISPGTSRIQIIETGDRVEKGNITKDYVPFLCLQCQESSCISACPQGAINRTGDIVTINADKCTGCQLCLSTCRYGLISFDGKREKAEKCDLCLTLDKRRPPFCVANCFGGALMWIPASELSEELLIKPDGTHRKVMFISQRREINVINY